MKAKTKMLLLLFTITVWHVAECVNDFNRSSTSSAILPLTPPVSEIVVMAVIPSTDHKDMDGNYVGHR